ncbi:MULTISPECIES: bifunctional 3-(3-hydroxy-phenyl)propionate/3-hydroxycinnamic acid hydroxylase [Pseudomonas]|uniref:bifunctional 3-(3-hydroxy-phenyl)propionate/3-hydroxycinnamic acid hydroxylase n=1 Tax=Pseudomonas sp. MIL9 TaxID=2807620 RepID=UPI00102A17D5|nr:bifunctional 3-(3-hydroxy-phenyl)propionate/3-hydroxycinnamic acid hydroxylase [Pseudomonas sp. MIL9]MBM6443860.1 bifunctional 3-(3-hydroxy-phenyl)propionate/3-hydroxycinnamic acid hydroxylase [Pseudomonas sp. MIL9]RZO06858.1 bifunctional 3-(3-hydroxy-phenyl)propionate/3-hydroxycinnamic acid hydroxylase [Pseudomonas moorei]
MTTLKLQSGVLVVGAGPTGLTLANLLGQSGINTILLDRKASTVAEPRAVSIDDESLRTMQAIGLEQDVLKDVVTGYGVHYFNRPGGHCFGKVEPTSMLYGFPKRNAFRQPLFEATLRQGLERFPSLKACFNHELLSFQQDAERVVALVKNDKGEEIEITASYLIACDGGRSPVRKQLGVAMVGSSFQSRWLVVDTDKDDDSFWQTRVYCDARRPVVDVPGPHHTRRFELMLRADETDEEVLSEGRLQELLRPFRGNKPTSIVRKTVYTFHARVAERWKVGRVFLAGDAAHLTPPYAGQGMNSGIRDAQNLGWKLVQVMKGILAPGILDTYESERRDHAWALIQLALNLGVVMAPASAFRAKLISGLFRAIGMVPPLRDYFLQMRFKPKPRFTKGLVIPSRIASPYKTGEMFPQPTLFDESDCSIKLDHLMGDGFSLIQCGRSDSNDLGKLRHPLWNTLNAKRILIEPAGEQVAIETTCSSMRTLKDKQSTLPSAFFESQAILLLRPDRYIAAIFDCHDEEHVVQALESLFQTKHSIPLTGFTMAAEALR